jgi:hypothetical protein
MKEMMKKLFKPILVVIKKLFTPVLVVLSAIGLTCFLIYLCIEYYIVCLVKIIRNKPIISLSDHLTKNFDPPRKIKLNKNINTFEQAERDSHLKPTKDRILASYARLKTHADRARMYVTYIQFFLLIYVAVKALHKSPIRDFIFEWWFFTFPVMILLFIFLCVLLGYWDHKSGIREKENETVSMQNPSVRKILEDLEEIKSKLK